MQKLKEYLQCNENFDLTYIFNQNTSRKIKKYQRNGKSFKSIDTKKIQFKSHITKSFQKSQNHLLNNEKQLSKFQQQNAIDQLKIFKCHKIERQLKPVHKKNLNIFFNEQDIPKSINTQSFTNIKIQQNKPQQENEYYYNKKIEQNVQKFEKLYEDQQGQIGGFPEDEKDQERIGEQSILKYFKHYKNLKNILNNNSYKNIDQNLYTYMLNNMDIQQLMPRKLGIITYQGNINNINLSHYKIGKHFLPIIVQSLQKINNCSQINLNFSYNNIDSNQFISLIDHISEKGVPKQINLQGNKIGFQGAQKLQCFLKNKGFQNLQNLILTDCNLNDIQLENYLILLKEQCLIKNLNLSCNKLGDLTASYLSQILLKPNQLKQLYLHKNLLTGKGVEQIFNSLLKNSNNLHLLDLSFNALGSLSKKGRIQNYYIQNYQNSKDMPISQCIYSLCQILCDKNRNQKIYHIDLSFTGFNLRECKKISKAINQNNSIYGLHIQGNKGFIDYNGFYLIPYDMVNINYIDVIPYQQINGFQKIKPIKYISEAYINNIQMQYLDICWICQGWQEEILIYQHHIISIDQILIQQNISSAIDQYSQILNLKQQQEFIENQYPTNVWINIYFNPIPKCYRQSNSSQSYLKFIKFKMNNQGQGIFSIKQLFPPDYVYFFFTIEEYKNDIKILNPITLQKYLETHCYQEYMQIKNIINKDYKCLNNSKNIQIYQQSQQQNSNSVPQLIFICELNLEELNFINFQQGDKEIIHDSHYYPLIEIIPRYKIQNCDKKQIKIWNIINSIFTQFTETDKQSHLLKCLEHDKQLLKIGQLLSDDELNYAQILKLYRYLSAISMSGNATKINLRVMRNYIQNTKIIQNTQFHLNDLDLIMYTATMQFSQQQLQNKSIFILRHHFIEIIFRISIDRSFKITDESASISMDRLLKDYLLPTIDEIDSQMWKPIRLFNESTDKVISRFKQTIQILFEKYSVLPKYKGNADKSQKRVYLIEFKQLFNDASLLDEIYFLERDINIAFNLSCNLNIDSLDEQPLSLNYYEFIEALARAAEKLALQPFSIKKEWSQSKRLVMPLCIKLEALIIHFINVIDIKQLKTQITHLQYSLFQEIIQQKIDSPNQQQKLSPKQDEFQNMSQQQNSQITKEETFKKQNKQRQQNNLRQKHQNLSLILNRLTKLKDYQMEFTNNQNQI